MSRFLLSLSSFALVASLSAQSYFIASCDGAQEVPPLATPALAKGRAVLNTNNTVTYELNAFGLPTAAFAAHFHSGAIGVAGPLLYTLTQTGPTTWAGTTTALTPAELTAINSNGFYMNIHTSANPNGEVRGQMLAVKPPGKFGTGCVGTNTQIPAISAGNSAAISMNFKIDLTNARASSSALLFLGNSNTAYGTLALPFNLGIIGMTGCTLYTNDLGAGLTSATSATGTGSVTIPIPFLTTIVGLQLFSQWFVVDPGANGLNLVTSDALQFVIR